ncbi:MAG: iron-containing alcohol dehydrogenase [Peptostreptococcaceae bacterium]|nr:iron-containing alcohol dehydrogenase [Peptostreptococcaceae bacterium]
MNKFKYYAPTEVIFGKDVENEVGKELLKSEATKVLIHYGSERAVKSGLLDRVLDSMEENEIEYVMLGGVVPNPRLAKVREGIKICKDENVDFVLAVGGGSVLDSAKAIAYGAVYNGDVWDFYEGKEIIKGALPHGNIITLAATGSETSSSSVITNEETGDKVGVNTDYGRPEFTLMNPELTYTLPPYQTACGIVDIMMHTFERYFSPGGLNDMTDEIAEAVIRNTKKYGSIAMETPEDYDARSELFWSGSISHVNLTGLGRTGDWASHRLEHELSGMFDVAHGAGLSAIWGAWARYTYKEAPERFIRMGEKAWELDLVNLQEKEAVEIMIDTVLKYFKGLGMPINTTELLGRQLSEEEILKLADNASKAGSRTLGNFKVLNREDMINIFRMSV